MPAKKGSSKKPDNKKPAKNVKFDKEENANITKAPHKENYPIKANLNLDDDELEKETELETEIEVELEEEKEELEEDLEDLDNIDEDHEVDDDVEYDEQEIDVIEDLYEDEEGEKPKKKGIKNKKKLDTEDDSKIEDEECEYDYSEIYDEKKEEPSVVVEASQRITLPKLTKYEKVRLIGTRAKQISLGAKVMIKNTMGMNSIDIAKLELEHKMIPMKVKRILPDNKIEIWKLSELDIDN